MALPTRSDWAIDEQLLALMGWPLKNAPPPAVAVYVRVTQVPGPPANSTTHAATGWLRSSTPAGTHAT